MRWHFLTWFVIGRSFFDHKSVKEMLLYPIWGMKVHKVCNNYISVSLLIKCHIHSVITQSPVEGTHITAYHH